MSKNLLLPLKSSVWLSKFSCILLVLKTVSPLSLGENYGASGSDACQT